MIGTILGFWGSIFTGAFYVGKSAKDSMKAEDCQRRIEHEERAWKQMRSEAIKREEPYPNLRETRDDFKERAQGIRNSRKIRIRFCKEYGYAMDEKDKELERLMEIDVRDLDDIFTECEARVHELYNQFEKEYIESIPSLFGLLIGPFKAFYEIMKDVYGKKNSDDNEETQK